MWREKKISWTGYTVALIKEEKNPHSLHCWPRPKKNTHPLFRTNSANIFINPRPAYRETEKGGEGERDTGITSGKGVTRHVARGYLHSCSLRRWRGTRGRSPPPHNPAHLDSLLLPQQILRMASNLEVVSMIADIGQQQGSCTNFRLSDRTLMSWVRIFVIWQELVKIQAAA